VTLAGKGDKTRVVPLATKTIEHLEALWGLHPNSQRGIALAIIRT